MAWSIILARCGVPIASRRRPNTECTTGGLRAVSPLRARTAKVFPRHWQEKFERRRTVFSIYTEFRGLAALSRRGNQPAAIVA